MTSTYVVSWTEENWYEVSVEANSEEEALEKIKNQNYDPKTGSMIEKIQVHRINKID